MIRNGATTDTQKHWMREKLIDGKNAAKAALEEGLLPGGGLALEKVAAKFKGTLLYEALKEPANRIRRNAGGKVEVDKKICDPLKVVRLAVEHACSVAAQMITIGAISAWEPEATLKDVSKAIDGKLVMEKLGDEATIRGPTMPEPRGD